MINNQFQNDFFSELDTEHEQRWLQKQKQMMKQEEAKKYNPALNPNEMDMGNLPDNPQTDLSFDVDDIKFNF